MSSIGRRLAGAGLGALFVVGLGSAGLAYAQTTDDSTPSTTSPPASAPASPNQDPNCPHMGSRGGGGGGGGSSISPAPAPSSGGDPGSV
jgi:hypothetical protein